MSNSTSIGRGPAHGSNENHDGDPRNTTFGETASQDEPPAGNDLIEEHAPDVPAGRPLVRQHPLGQVPGRRDQRAAAPSPGLERALSPLARR